MDVENTFIKPLLLFYFGKGLDEAETRKEIFEQYPQLIVSSKTIDKWFAVFRKANRGKVNLKSTKKKKKFTDEFLIDLINKNPDLSMGQLAKLADSSCSVISKRIRQINSKGERVNYIKKVYRKDISEICSKSRTILTDESLINLIIENPDLNMRELGKATYTSTSVICKRLKEINSNGERVNYELKKPGKPKKISDEFLIKLVNENPGLNMTELSKLAGTCQKTISRRIKQINSDGERLNYQRKRASKFTDEFLINLINENPNLNMRELAKIVNTSAVTISQRIRRINNNGKKVKYVKKLNQKYKPEANKDLQPREKLTDEFFIDLISNNPSLSMKELAVLANRSQSTISNRLKQINSNGERVKYIKKHSKWRSGIHMESLDNLVNCSANFNA